MTTSKGTEPAFPCIYVVGGEVGSPEQVWHYLGVTKREWFAGLALQGLIAAESRYTAADGEPFADAKTNARAAVELADALLEELTR